MITHEIVRKFAKEAGDVVESLDEDEKQVTLDRKLVDEIVEFLNQEDLRIVREPCIKVAGKNKL